MGFNSAFKGLISVNYGDIYRSPLVSKLLKHLLRTVLYMTVIRTRILHLGKHLTLYNSCYGPIIQTLNNEGIMHMKDDCLYHISNVAVMNILTMKAEWECMEL